METKAFNGYSFDKGVVFWFLLRFSMGSLDIIFVSRVSTLDGLDCIFRLPRHGIILDRRLKLQSTLYYELTLSSFLRFTLGVIAP